MYRVSQKKKQKKNIIYSVQLKKIFDILTRNTALGKKKIKIAPKKPKFIGHSQQSTGNCLKHKFFVHKLAS